MSMIETATQLATAIIERPQHIAECMQRISRFNGQHPTSNVLNHSLDVFQRLQGTELRVQMWGLLHDAHEMLSGDVARNWKTDALEQRQREEDAIIAALLGIEITRDERRMVTTADVVSGNVEYVHWDKTVYTTPHELCVPVFVRIVERWTKRAGFRKEGP